MKEKIRQAIIDWLGLMYDPGRRRSGNPDYFQPEDVEELATILDALFHSENKEKNNG